jgi:ubiquinone/menaquinone biosynthesis C-methylase UbiE
VVNLRNNDVEFESGKIMRDTDNSSQESRDTGSDDFKIADADSYNSVVDYFDQYTERFTSHLPAPILAMAKIPAAGKVLDVGTGTGVVALEIARSLGESASVTGIDLSDGMLATAREKALQKGLAGRISYLKMDAEQLALNDNSFDAAVSLYALRHFPNPGKSVAEIYRVLKPGARIVAAVGSRPSLFSIAGISAAFRRLGSTIRQAQGRELAACEFIDGLVEKYIPKPVGDEIAGWVGEQHGFSGSIKELVEEAGFVDIKSDWKGQYSIIESTEDFWLLQMTFSSLARKRVAGADRLIIDKLKSEFYHSCEQVLKKNGRLVYQTGAAIVSAQKPLS